MSDPIDTNFTENVVCPYCGYNHDNSDEWFRDGGNEVEVECEECGKVFIAEADYSVLYISRKKKNENEK